MRVPKPDIKIATPQPREMIRPMKAERYQNNKLRC